MKLKSSDDRYKGLTESQIMLLKNSVYQPRDYQLREARFYDEFFRGNISAPRTGKTYTTLSNLFYLYNTRTTEGHRKASALIVIAPADVHSSWVNYQLPKLRWPDIPYKAFYWRQGWGHKDYESLERVLYDPDILLVATFTKDGFHTKKCREVIDKILANRRTMGVVDESHHFSRVNSTRTQVLIGFPDGKPVLEKAVYRRILTGTPALEGSFQLWPQGQILKNGIFGIDDYRVFCELYREDTYDGRTRNVNSGTLAAKMASFCSIVTAEDAKLPPILEETCKVKPVHEQLDWVSKIRQEFIIEHEEGKFSFSNLRNLHGKEQQISSGFLIKPDRSIIYLNKTDKIKTLIDEVKAAKEPLIIWSMYRAETAMIKGALSIVGIRYVHYSGTAEERQKAYDAFKPGASEDNPRVLIASHASMSEGFDLGRARLCFHMSSPFSAVKQEQANQRTVVHGGTGSLVKYIICLSVDAYILRRHKEKRKESEEILTPVKQLQRFNEYEKNFYET